MKFVTTRFAARQFVSHGHILQWKKGNNTSYSLKDGDIIEAQKSKEIPIVLEAISSTERDTPEYLSVDYDKMKGTFLKPSLMKSLIQLLWNQTWLSNIIQDKS